MWLILSDFNKKFVYYNVVYIHLKNNKSLKKLSFLFLWSCKDSREVL
jgi:hypothetical protein